MEIGHSKCLECGAKLPEPEWREALHPRQDNVMVKVQFAECAECGTKNVLHVHSEKLETPKLDDDFKFMVIAHNAHQFKNVPDDCIQRCEGHDDALCHPGECVCLCADCIDMRQALVELIHEDEEEVGRGELDYWEVRRMILENQATAKRVR